MQPSNSNVSNTNPSNASSSSSSSSSLSNTTTTTTTATMVVVPTPSTELDLEFDDDWEEWDSSKSPFWIHCLAGSMAGVAEHVLVYPLDTVRTHIQVCAACHGKNVVLHNNSGNVLQQAARNATTNAAASMSSSSSSSRKTTTATATATATTSGSSSSLRSSGGLHNHTNRTQQQHNMQHHHNTMQHNMHKNKNNTNLSMLQAFRQLTVTPRMALETTTTTATATTTAAVNSSSTTTTTNTTTTLLHQTIHGVKNGTTTSNTNTHTPTTNARDMVRLWRGVQSVLVGCIPAHALYFGMYEMVKAATTTLPDGQPTAYGSSLAGAAAVVCHDLVLGPLDTVKQRLQLGHYKGLRDALTQMIREEGIASLYRSFPVTLATNIPYGMIMVGTNEFLKDKWTTNNELTLGVTLGASSVAGLVAAATTTPLDRIKTYLQTQQLAPSCLRQTTKAHVDCPMKPPVNTSVVAANWQQAAVLIYRHEGLGGFVRGILPRILSHTPAVAISWTTYETCKKYLLLRNNP